MAQILSTFKNPALISRHEQLAIANAIKIDNAIHALNETLRRGTLLGKGANGKYRAYAEAPVTVAFSAASPNFTLDPADINTKNFRVGDVIESVAGLALGTILTFNSVTGVGTLTANSANALAIGQRVRATAAVIAINVSNGKLLQDEVVMGSADEVAVGYFEGFFVTSQTSLTAAAKTAMGAIDVAGEADEVRLK
jgi:hypothetical protein